ncbi:hypothetical protein VNI00_012557 [Paramarasmius palmivorus]|uniref:A to I editase domain-containing protein n=1 Tax=Paramarasmius palmivorus TaxID=297713 RepID=A0AAW0C509_9AGAR
MAGTAASFGDTLSSGIQDVAALLPLLGTEQCERHVGSALEKGYLYAAASALSLFGSLGIVKATFAAFLAVITYPFYGGRWLGDAGFATPGSVSSMVTLDEETGMYGAELKLQKLMEEQHIDDPKMVSSFEWSGWRRGQGAYNAEEAARRWNGREWDEGGRSVALYMKELFTDIIRRDLRGLVRDIKALGRRIGFDVQHIIRKRLEYFYSWNALLIITSALCAIVSMSPYIYLASNDWSNPLSWVYPALRSFGSFLCVVCTQLALQLRIQQIMTISIAWMDIRRRYTNITEDTHTPLEERLRAHLRSSSSLEEGQQALPKAVRKELTALLAVDPMLVVYQLLSGVGIAMIVAGYVGCFSLVGSADVTAGPYVWFAMETFLSLIRVFLWGLNPLWDETTGLTMSLRLHDSESPYYPLITSPNPGETLGFGETTSSPKPFAVYSEDDFFAAATTWIGPLPRLEANAITLYYALIAHKTFLPPRHTPSRADESRKYLCITMLLTDSRSFTFLCHDEAAELATVFLSKLEVLPGTGSYQVLLNSEIKGQSDGFLRSKLFRDVVRHGQDVSVRLFGERQNQLPLKWTLSTSQALRTPGTPIYVEGAALSGHDGEYVNLRRWWEFMFVYLQHRQRARREASQTTMDQDELPDFFYDEVLDIIESALFELYLYGRECGFIESRREDEKLALQLLPECIQAMRTRIAMEKRDALSRYHKYEWDKLPWPSDRSEPLKAHFEKAWDSLEVILRKLRVSPEDDDLGRRVKGLWGSVGREADGITVELCTRLLPLSIHKLVLQSNAGQGSKEFRLRNEIDHLSQLLMTIVSVKDSPPATDMITDVPYVSVRSAFDLAGIRTNARICALGLDPDRIATWSIAASFKRHDLKDYLDMIAHPDQDDQAGNLTTLIVNGSWPYHDRIPREAAIPAVVDHIAKSPNILFLCGMGSGLEQPHVRAALANRRAWQDGIQHSTSLAYRVGFEGPYSDNLEARGESIKLCGAAQCIVLYHSPGEGHLTLTLIVRRPFRIPMGLQATLKSDTKGEAHSQTYTITGDHEHSSAQFHFNGLRKGHGEIRIARSDRLYWELHGSVGVEWRTGETAGIEGME